MLLDKLKHAQGKAIRGHSITISPPFNHNFPSLTHIDYSCVLIHFKIQCDFKD